jgi:DNA-directed RNA polymerase subunit RPC12/RpoP
MIQTFQCPNCHAPLNYETESHDLTISCDYCNSSIIVPESLRREGKTRPISNNAYMEQSQQLAEVMRLVKGGNKIGAIKLFRETFNVGLAEAKEIVETMERNGAIHLGEMTVSTGTPFVLSQTEPQSRGAGRIAGCIFVTIMLAVGLSVVVPLLIGGAATWWGIREAGRISEGEILGSSSLATPSALNIEQTIEASLRPLEEILGGTPEVAPEATAEPGLLELVRTFGSEGVGPGLFQDTRGIGVDREGHIYTGDYSNGRVQLFDADGRYLTEWNAGENLYMSHMAVDETGIFYTINRNELTRFQGRTGERLPSLAAPAAFSPQGLAALPGGGVLVYGNGRLLWFDADGTLSRDAANLPQFQLGSTYQNMVVSRGGDIYINASGAVLRFDAEGQFLNQIAARGDGLDQMPRQPTGMALDSQDRLFLMPTSSSVWVFDRNGRHLETVSLRTMGFYMVINSQDQLLIMNRNAAQVEIYQISDE